MPIDAGPHHIDATGLILAPNGDATLKPVTPTFYQDLDTEFDSFAGHLVITQHTFTDPWPTWEVHPHGDEFVLLISGDIDFVLSTSDGEQTLRVNQPGTYVMVPKGIWHTARPRVPTTMLFVTPGEGTLNAEEPTPPVSP
jgi:mannose-6-phosphate isomerase-like protein (cupin superfamily)